MAMTLPSPDDMVDAPTWENYIVAQCVQAALGLIPVNTLAVAVTIDGTAVTVHFQVSELTDDDNEDVSDIESNLLSLVGSKVDVDVTVEVVDQRDPSRLPNARWVYIRHA